STVGLADAGHTLVITGDAGNNRVSIVQDDAHDQIKVTYDAVIYFRHIPIHTTLTQTFSSSQINQVRADLGDGNDSLLWSLGAGSNFTFGKTAWIDLGAGDDSAGFNIGVGATQGHLLQGTLNLTVYGRSGNDSVYANFGHKDGGMLNFNALMG